LKFVADRPVVIVELELRDDFGDVSDSVRFTVVVVMVVGVVVVVGVVFVTRRV